MESNSIGSLPEGFLGRFTQLQYIRMAHNQLTDKGIPPNTFNVTGLVELDLSFNKLERIPPVSTTLQHLYLQANQIKGKFCSSFVYTHLCRKPIRKSYFKNVIKGPENILLNQLFMSNGVIFCQVLVEGAQLEKLFYAPIRI